jgi:drug/metabolite transporter (DMT)-like permease
MTAGAEKSVKRIAAYSAEPPPYCASCTGRPRGLALALVGTLSVSPDALLTRLAERNGGDHSAPWAFICFRTLVVAILSLAYVLLSDTSGSLSARLSALRVGFFAGPWHITVAAVMMTVVNCGFPLSFLWTKAAKALLFISLNPLWSALLGWRLLGDALPVSTIIAMVSACCAILLVVVPPLATGEGTGGSWTGDVAGVVTGLGLAGFINASRYGARPDASARPDARARPARARSHAAPPPRTPRQVRSSVRRL